MDLVVRNGKVVTPGSETVTDVGIRDGLIVQLGGEMTGEREIDATDRLVLPGGIDAHVHLTAPGTGPQSWRWVCLLYTSPSPRDATLSRMPSSA